MSGARVGKSTPVCDAGTVATERAHNLDVRAHGASVVQVETLGKHGVAILWISAFIGAAALVTSIAFAFWIDRVSARVYVLEYDAGRICARLEEKQIVEGCH